MAKDSLAMTKPHKIEVKETSSHLQFPFLLLIDGKPEAQFRRANLADATAMQLRKAFNKTDNRVTQTTVSK